MTNRAWAGVKAPGRRARLRFPMVDRIATAAEFVPVSLSRPVVVYSMGKTGTTSLTQAIERETGRAVLKVHSLNRARLDDEARASESRGERPRFQWRSDALRRVVERTPHRQWDFVSVVRDPIARALSAYFHIQRESLSTASERPGATGRALDAVVEDFVRRIALERDWFVEELRHATGIDPYEEPFDPDVGYAILRRERFRVLVLRNEDLQETAPAALATFFDLPSDVELPRLNSGRSTDLEYLDFVERWRPPPALVTAVYETRMMRHFYGQDRIDEFKCRWSGPS
jgi:hypothetical protein